MPEETLRLKLSIRFFSGAQKCFGPGAAALLEGVDRTGSLRGAAAGMGMAYSNAWTALRDCEEHLGFSLLERKAGGRSGGRSSLTREGRALLEGYLRLSDRLEKEGAALLAELNLPQRAVDAPAQSE